MTPVDYKTLTLFAMVTRLFKAIHIPYIKTLHDVSIQCTATTVQSITDCMVGDVNLFLTKEEEEGTHSCRAEIEIMIAGMSL